MLKAKESLSSTVGSRLEMAKGLLQRTKKVGLEHICGKGNERLTAYGGNKKGFPFRLSRSKIFVSPSSQFLR